MFHLRTIFNDDDHAAILRRLDRLEPSMPRHWGQMNAHQAVVHLNDSMKGILGERPAAKRRFTLKRRLVRFIGFTLPFPWPRGTVRTSPENDQLQQGTKPGDFRVDVAELKTLVQRIRQSEGRGLPAHYAWGEMKPSVLGRYVIRHMDHHLKQFGV